MSEPLKKIAICGHGLAGLLCAASLLKSLPSHVKLVLINSSKADYYDIFYGTTSSPSAYEMLLNIDLPEPELLPNSFTSFSLGTIYSNWGIDALSWPQCFHTPLPVIRGVEFHHFLTKSHMQSPNSVQIEDYIFSALAAKHSVFAHPRQDQNTPLSTLEYGYHFHPGDWCALLKTKITGQRIELIDAELDKVLRHNDQVAGLQLSNGQTLEADLYIDATGQQSDFKNHKKILSSRTLKAVESFEERKGITGSCRLLEGKNYGWQARTPLQDKDHILTLFSPSSEEDALKDHSQSDANIVDAPLGYVKDPWRGNCVSIGTSAFLIEPLSTAPLKLLQRDIERLLELIPVYSVMKVEQREYNRRFKDDVEHASAFQQAFFETVNASDTPYWTEALNTQKSEKLKTKIKQFQSRGSLVQYDLEPFSKEEWIQQHIGLGRWPDRYDPLVDNIPESIVSQNLEAMKNANQTMIKNLPTHEHYMMRLLQYFRKKNEG